MEPNQQKKTSKQNITRDIEIKNKLTVTRGEVEVGNGGRKGGGLSRNMYKGHMDKAKWGYDKEWEVGMAGVEGSGGGKMETTVLEQQFKKKRKKKKRI